MKATNYRHQTIGDSEFELRPVQAEKKDIGFVPVANLAGTTTSEVVEQITNILNNHVNGLDAELFCKLARNGIAIHLQALARTLVSDDGPTASEIAAQIDAMSPEDQATYHGRYLALQAEGKRLAVLAKANGKVNDANYIFTELC
jgi:hypothetical protein